ARLHRRHAPVDTGSHGPGRRHGRRRRRLGSPEAHRPLHQSRLFPAGFLRQRELFHAPSGALDHCGAGAGQSRGRPDGAFRIGKDPRPWHPRSHRGDPDRRKPDRAQGCAAEAPVVRDIDRHRRTVRRRRSHHHDGRRARIAVCAAVPPDGGRAQGAPRRRRRRGHDGGIRNAHRRRSPRCRASAVRMEAAPLRSGRRGGAGGGSLAIPAVILLLTDKAAVWIAALSSGTSGGVLAPLLIMGGALGALEAHWMPFGGQGFWALLGMAAILGGTMRAPLTASLFAVELTGNIGVLPAVLAACIAAFAVTVLLMRRSILTERVARRGHHVTREYATDPFLNTRVEAIMATPAHALAASIPVREAVEF